MVKNLGIPTSLVKKFVEIGDFIFSVFLFVTILALFIYTSTTIFHFFLEIVQFRKTDVVHNIAYIIVLMKAYKILLHYFQYHHLSIKYLVQISIIAPAVEVIFAVSTQELSISILFALYSLANLIIYIFFHKELEKIGY